MTIRKCTCGEVLTTKTCYSIGRKGELLYINCKKCESTLVVASKKYLMERAIKKVIKYEAQ